MSDLLKVSPLRRGRGWAAVALLLIGSGAISSAWGQTAAAPGVTGPPPAPQLGPTAPPPTPNLPRSDPHLRQVGCESCGGILGLASGGGCSSCGTGCIPGRKPCCPPCEGDNIFGRIVNGLSECICCPDHCYEGMWCPIADSAFFVDAPRPVTQTRFRWEGAFDFTNPDRAEYIIARMRLRKGAVIQPPMAAPGMMMMGNVRVGTPKGPPAVRELDYNDFRYYTEAATGRFSASIEVPYREVNGVGGTIDFSGFGDIVIGTKSLMVDCPLGQLSSGFKIYTPVGQASKGLGTGHVSLEPSILLGLRLAQNTYLQTQYSYWIPIGGDQEFAGDIFHYHLSLNQLLWKPCPRLLFIGTLECNGWSVLDGGFTSLQFRGPLLNQFSESARSHIFSAGPGLRCFICDVLDVGVGAAFAITDPNFGGEVVRAELRWRF